MHLRNPPDPPKPLLGRKKCDTDRYQVPTDWFDIPRASFLAGHLVF